MAHVYPLVHDGDHGLGAARGRAPGLGRIRVRVGRAARLAGIVEAPQLVVARVVRGRRGPELEVRLGVRHARRARVLPDGLLHGEISRQAHHVHVALRQVLFDARVVLLVDLAQVDLRGWLLERDDDLTGRKSPA